MAHARVRPMTRLILGLVLLTSALTLVAVPLATPVGAQDDEHDELDPFRDLPLPCEAVSTTQIPRTARNIEHVANVCEIVGTDVEFQSREADDGIHDYAFVGTMGFGFRIFDITDPTNPTIAMDEFEDGGWQNDVQVRGDIVVTTYDGLSGDPTGLSPCLLLKDPTAFQQGVDIYKLEYDPATAQFEVVLSDCIANPPGGAHNATLHPSGEWLMIANSSSDWAVDFIDLTGVLDEDPETGPVHRWRLIDEFRWDTTSTRPPGERCPDDADFQCLVVTRPEAPALGHDPATVPCGGALPEPCPEDSPYGTDSAYILFDPHDIFFSEDGLTMYVAALESTVLVDIEPLLNPEAVFEPIMDGEEFVAPPAYQAMTIIPNLVCAANAYSVPGVSQQSCGPDEETDGLDNPHNLQLSHQADTTSDGLILAISDERGGGLSETSCQEDPAGVIGGVHFWALGDLGEEEPPGIDTSQASPTNPVRLGAYFNPNPGLGVDPLQGDVEELPRAERACTSHVFRFGGNGTMSPGAGGNLDGVSRLDERHMTLAWYGAGIWWLDTAGPTDHEEAEIPEEPRSTWGNTLGWIVMPGSEAWSGKTYKAIPAGDLTVQAEGDPVMYIYAGDIVRGFDIYRFSPGFVVEPVDPTPGPTTTASPTGGATEAGATTRPPNRGQIPNTATGLAVGVRVASAIIVLASVGALAGSLRRRSRGAA